MILSWLRFDHAPPPFESLAGHRPCRPAAVRRPPLRRTAVVAIAHHQEQDVAGDEAVALPVALDRIRPPLAMHLRELWIQPFRIDPFAKPPLRILARAAAIVIAEQLIDLLDPMLLRRSQLFDHRRAFCIGRRRLRARDVSQVQHDVPVEGRAAVGAAELALRDRLGDAAPSLASRSLCTCEQAPAQTFSACMRCPFHCKTMPASRITLVRLRRHRPR